MIILNVLKEEKPKPRRFFKKTTQENTVKSETVFVNGLPHYVISAPENSFSKGELFDFLKKYKGKILAVPVLLNNKALSFLMFDITNYNKQCAFYALCRYLKSGEAINKALYIADENGVLSKELCSVLPFVKSVGIFTSSPLYGDDFLKNAFMSFGVTPIVKPYNIKKETDFFADFDTLLNDGTLTLVINGAKKELHPEIIRKKAEGANRLRALGIEEKYIYAAF